jgi:myotubularin-related protein 1/2
MIYDSRPRLNAEANKIKGGGYEDTGEGNNYANCKIQFCDIENIHAVRSGFDKM